MYIFLINTHYYCFRRLVFLQNKPPEATHLPNNRDLFLGPRFLCMHKILEHAQHSSACTTLLCMHWTGQGPGLGPKKAAGPQNYSQNYTQTYTQNYAQNYTQNYSQNYTHNFLTTSNSCIMLTDIFVLHLIYSSC